MPLASKNLQNPFTTPDKQALGRQCLGETCTATLLWSSIDDWSLKHLGEAPLDILFCHVGTGIVVGLECLAAGPLLFKLHASGHCAKKMHEIQNIQRYLRRKNFPCPMPKVEPQAFVRGVATVESFERRGALVVEPLRDVVESMAGVLWTLNRHLREYREVDSLGHSWFWGLAKGQLWPDFMARRFNFAAHDTQAQWIDHFAQEARMNIPLASFPTVIGHFDWRLEHLLFESGDVSMIYDWDSLHRAPEAVIVGAAAHAYSVIELRDNPNVPTLEGMQWFVDAYCRARGQTFDSQEKNLCARSCVYALAFNARVELSVSSSKPRFGERLQEVGNLLLNQGF
jgi:hypothetical protein